jgi:D-3-phosphoglycerate dehydrogenase
MSEQSPVVWTDIDLVDEAREIISKNGFTLDHRKEGSTDGLDRAAAIIAGSLIRGDRALYAIAPKLLVIARSGIGYDRIDVDAATAAGVCAVNTPDAPTESTAEFAVALILSVARKVPIAAASLATGIWSPGVSLVGFDLAGKTLGLAGCGRIGRRVAEIARGFRMNVVAFDPYVESMPEGVTRAKSLEEMFAISDVVSLHLPASKETRHIVNAETLQKFKHGAILINTSRGPLIDEAALCEALKEGHIAGAGLDVWDPEPTAPDNPLLNLSNVVATPHIAAATREGRRRSHTAAATQVVQVLNGERPAFLLNPTVWDRRRSHAL